MNWVHTKEEIQNTRKLGNAANSPDSPVQATEEHICAYEWLLQEAQRVAGRMWDVLSLVTAPVCASEWGLTRHGGSPHPRCRSVVCQGGGGGGCVQVRGVGEPSPDADARDPGGSG